MERTEKALAAADGKGETAGRCVFLDYLRVVACLMVVMIHCCEPYYIGDEGRCQVASAADAFWVAMVEMVCRSCVPLFVMTSAYLLFPVRGSTGDFFRRRLTRVGLPYVLWCGYYSLVYGSPLHRILFNFPDAGGHLWFVPMLLGLYVLMPLLSPWAERVGERELRGWILVWLATTLLPFARKLSVVLFGEPGFGVVPQLWGEAPWNPFGTFHYVSGFVGYVLLGLYFRRFARALSLRETLKRALPLLCAGSAGMAFGFYFRFGGRFPFDAPYACTVDFELTLEYCSTFVALAVVGWFMVFRTFAGAGRLYRRLVLPLSKASYGTYLVHMTILLTLLPHFKAHLPTPVAIVSLGLTTFAAASLVSLAGRRVPRVGAWLFG
ncbi:MAG: acyltransferase family protein [Kiritimatiellae bacterium]|nr:acyltransferase family protein [Kiritimatiellia bacterium]